MVERASHARKARKRGPVLAPVLASNFAQRDNGRGLRSETLETVVATVEEARVGVHGFDLPSDPDVLETIREELRPLAREVVRRLVVELAREELGRLGATLNGRPPPTAESVLLGPKEPQESTRPRGEGSAPPPAAKAMRRLCSACGEEKPARAFEAGRRTCRACRAEAARRNYRKRHGQTHAARTNGGGAEEGPG
jgi:hypothetical protein